MKFNTFIASLFTLAFFIRPALSMGPISSGLVVSNGLMSDFTALEKATAPTAPTDPATPVAGESNFFVTWGVPILIGVASLCVGALLGHFVGK